MGRPLDPLYDKKWRLDRHRGITRTVDTKAARVHIEALAMEGASYRRIAVAAGCSVQAICHIRDGQPMASRKIVDGILAVTMRTVFDRAGDEDFVPNVGSRRRLRALAALGHSAETIAAAVGRDRGWVYNALHGPGRWHSRRKWELVCQAYEALSMTPGTSGKTRTLAAQHGYLPPMAWDDDDIDDPYAAPLTGEEAPVEGDGDIDEVAVERAMAGRRLSLTKAEHRLVVARLNDRGLSAAQIADLLGTTERQVERWKSYQDLSSRWSA